MSNIQYIKYGRRHNLGNYEHEELTIDAIVKDNQSFEEVFDLVKTTVLDALELRNVSTDAKLKARLDIQKKLMPNVVPYNRQLKTHTDILYGLFTEILPLWNTKFAVECKTTSLKLVGRPFLDESGKVVEIFKEDLFEILLSELKLTGQTKTILELEEYKRKKELNDRTS